MSVITWHIDHHAHLLHETPLSPRQISMNEILLFGPLTVRLALRHLHSRMQRTQC